MWVLFALVWGALRIPLSHRHSLAPLSHLNSEAYTLGHASQFASTAHPMASGSDELLATTVLSVALSALHQSKQHDHTALQHSMTLAITRRILDDGGVSSCGLLCATYNLEQHVRGIIRGKEQRLHDHDVVRYMCACLLCTRAPTLALHPLP